MKNKKMNDSVVVNESLLTCSFSILIAICTFIGHFGLGLFYYYKTGTFPFRERVRSRIEELRELNELDGLAREQPLLHDGQATEDGHGRRAG